MVDLVRSNSFQVYTSNPPPGLSRYMPRCIKTFKQFSLNEHVYIL